MVIIVLIHIKYIALADVSQWIECQSVNQSHWFDSQSGHMPGLWASSPIWGV